MRTKRAPRLLPAALAGALAVTGCTHIGPRTVAADRFDYSTALAESWKQQTLLNIVKLRYLDLPVFVDVASIIAGYSLQTGVTVGGTVSSDKAVQGNFATAGAQAIYIDRPTITYVPMTGEKFLRGLITPISPRNIFFMLQILGAFATFIEVPEAHLKEHRAVPVPDHPASDGRQDAVKIHSGTELPTDAYAAVFYRGHWFWIDDADWQTKRALTAVMFFFTLEGTGATENLPLVTIPAQ